MDDIKSFEEIGVLWAVEIILQRMILNRLIQNYLRSREDPDR